MSFKGRIKKKMFCFLSKISLFCFCMYLFSHFRINRMVNIHVVQNIFGMKIKCNIACILMETGQKRDTL